MKIKLAPSILAADFTRLGEQIREAETSGADWIHIDVMDGRFVPNISFGALVVEAARRVTSLPLDVHLMIVEPEQQLEKMAKAGADSISVHVETCPHLHSTLQHIKKLGLKAGVALNPHTPAVMIQEVLPLLDEILVMTVNPGAGGQAFLPETMPKLQQLRQMAGTIDILVDGGIDADTVSTVVAHGANVLVAGSSVFGTAQGVRAGIHTLRGTLENKNAGR
ncbi:MAG: ribulose-phosphate 3-epimerase [Anaerolineae bacterium]|nr:ribulose-phosphate 3-epimerase [Anaerolineae bacterium]